jgi:malonyl-CoA O-methyltransferase
MTKSCPLISIVLPTYNGARYLRDAIESCLHQTYPTWELILVDDASTDDTPSIIAEYRARDGRLAALRNPVNRKLPGSLNVGFARARGQLLTWTSDDNCYRPEALSEMAAFLKANPSVDLVYADFTLIDDEGATTGEGWAAPIDELPVRNVIGPCFLYRRAVHEALGGYAEDLFLVEDWDFFLRASIAHRLAFLRKDLYQYRWHKNSLTVTQSQTAKGLAVETCLARNLPRITWMSRDVCERAGKLLESIIRDREAMEGIMRLMPVIEEIRRLIPPESPFILVDEEAIRSTLAATRKAIPFLERDGEYWGPPPDDETAIREFERLRRGGASFLVFAEPAFWWLDYYARFHRHLRGHFACLLDNERLIVFDLRGQGEELPPPVFPEEPSRPSDLTRPPDAAAWEREYLTPVSAVTGLSSPVAQAVAGLTAPGDVLLEAGCGSGTLSAELATAGRVIQLCDFSQAILDRAADLFRVSGLPPPSLTLCDLTRPLPWPDKAVDVAWNSGVLEHWTDDELLPIVGEMARISRKCVISLVPYAGCVFYRLGKHVAEERGCWPYGREIPRRTLKPVFERAGLSDVREWTVWNEWGPRLLGLIDVDLERLVCEWWDSLSPDDPAKETQGYLLLTVGFRDHQPGRDPMPIENRQGSGRTSAMESDRLPAPARALRWVRAHEVDSGGIRVHSEEARPYPEVTGYLVPTLLAYGERELAVRSVRWLLSVQGPEGFFPDAYAGKPYIFDTGQILRGLLAAASLVPAAGRAARRAADWLCSEMVDGGAGGFGDRYSGEIPETVHLYVLPALLQASEFLSVPGYRLAAERCLNFYCGHEDFLRIDDLTHFLAYELEALIDLGRPDLAAPVLERLRGQQAEDGAVRGEGGANWVCSPGLAQLAICWYKLGEAEPADRAMAWLEAHQQPSGGFLGSYGEGGTYFATAELSWAAKFFLDAHLLRVALYFDRNADNADIFPSSVPRDDPRAQAIIALVRPHDQVLEVGCGKGRFLKAVHEAHSETRCTGVDISPAFLSQLPEYVRALRGSLESIPCPDNSFDVTFSVEAIEHSANIDAVVAELIRVTRPGGSVVVIDKQQAHWGRLDCPSWEHWPEAEQISRLLGRGCDQVTAGAVSPDGLMLVWSGRKRLAVRTG